MNTIKILLDLDSLCVLDAVCSFFEAKHTFYEICVTIGFEPTTYNNIEILVNELHIEG